MSRKGQLPWMMVTGAPLLVAGAAWAVHAALMLLCPFQLDYGEGAALELAAALARGETLYPDPALPPYRISPYAPLYLWLASLLMGAEADFFSGRLLSVASAAILVVLVAVWVGKRRGGLAGALAAAFLLAHPLLFNWSCLFRVDTLGLTLTAGGLMLVSSPGPTRCLAAGLLLGLAFLTKQSFLAGPLAAGILLLAQRRLRELALLALGLGLSALLPALALDRLSGGQLLDLWFRFNAMPYDPDQVLRYWARILPSLAALAPLAAAAGADRERRGDLAVWAVYAATSFTAAWGAGRFGSFYNYFLELQVALAVLAACGTAWLAAHASALLRGGALTLTALQLFWLGPGTSLEYLYAPWLYLRHEGLPLLQGRLPAFFSGLLQNGYALGPWLQGSQGPILAENLGNPVVWGRLPWLCDPATYFKLAEMGLWDEEPLLRRIDQGFFDVILLQKVEGNIRFPPRVLQRILQSYAQVGQAGVDRVFLPRARSGAPGPEGFLPARGSWNPTRPRPGPPAPGPSEHAQALDSPVHPPRQDVQGKALPAPKEGLLPGRGDGRTLKGTAARCLLRADRQRCPRLRRHAQSQESDRKPQLPQPALGGLATSWNRRPGQPQDVAGAEPPSALSRGSSAGPLADARGRFRMRRRRTSPTRLRPRASSNRYSAVLPLLRRR